MTATLRGNSLAVITLIQQGPFTTVAIAQFAELESKRKSWKEFYKQRRIDEVGINMI